MNIKSLSFVAFYTAFFAAVYFFVFPFCEKQTDGFSIARIHSDLPFNPECASAPLSPKERRSLAKICAQPFHYLGSGGQCFAFASEDGQYVIKFFKHKFRKPDTLFLSLPLFGPLEKMRLKQWNRALSKYKRDFTSYKIAYDKLKDETGLLMIHLNKSRDLNQEITLIDKLNIKHRISLDQVEFVVQKKAELVYTYLEKLMQRQDIEGARTALRSILSLVVARSKKGIFDEDAKIHRNFGFLKEKAVVIDVGRFRYDDHRIDPEVYSQDLQMVTKQLRLFLEKSYPMLTSILDEEIQKTP